MKTAARGRLDQCQALVFVPVPEEVMKETERRIHTEQQRLKEAGKDAKTTPFREVERILNKCEVFE